MLAKLILLVLLILPAYGYEIEQSFVGEGQWYTATKLGSTATEITADTADPRS
jgi:DNA-binding PadR family transcriptional regulator